METTVIALISSTLVYVYSSPNDRSAYRSLKTNNERTSMINRTCNHPAGPHLLSQLRFLVRPIGLIHSRPPIPHDPRFIAAMCKKSDLPDSILGNEVLFVRMLRPLVQALPDHTIGNRGILIAHFVFIRSMERVVFESFHGLCSCTEVLRGVRRNFGESWTSFGGFRRGSGCG